MIKLELSKETWETAQQYWQEIYATANSYEKLFKFLHESIFSNNQLNSENNDGGVYEITTINVPSIDTMTTIMDQIENDNKLNDNNNDTFDNKNNNLSTNQKLFIEKPFKKFKLFENDLSYQIKLFKQFCQKNEGVEFGNHYECNELDFSLFNNIEECNKYELLWNDFVSLRLNLFESKSTDQN